MGQEYYRPHLASCSASRLLLHRQTRIRLDRRVDDCVPCLQHLETISPRTMGNLPVSLLALVSEFTRELCWTRNRGVLGSSGEQYFVGEVLLAGLCCSILLGV